MNDDNSIGRGSTHLLAAQIAGNAGFFVAILILARGLEPAERGIVAFVIASSMVVGRSTKFGVSEATTVFLAQRPELRGVLLTNLVWFASVSAALGAALFVLGLSVIDGVAPAGLDSTMLALLAAGVLANSLVESGNVYLLGCGRIRDRAWTTAVAPWVYAALLGISLVDGLSAVEALSAWLIAHGIWAVMVLAISTRVTAFARPSVTVLVTSLRFGIRAWAGSLASFLNYRLDQVLMGLIAAEATLGVYAVAVNAAEVLLYLPGAAATALLPLTARTSGPERVERTLVTFRVVLLLTAVASVLAAAAGPTLLPRVFGSPYEPSATPFLVLIPGALGFTASWIFTSALLASSAPGRSSAGPVTTLVIGVALDLLLIPRYGATGAAVAASTALIAGGIVATVAYVRFAAVPPRLLVPRPADAVRVSSFVKELRRR